MFSSCCKLLRADMPKIFRKSTTAVWSLNDSSRVTLDESIPELFAHPYQLSSGLAEPVDVGCPFTGFTYVHFVPGASRESPGRHGLAPGSHCSQSRFWSLL